jgi:hypothetical protein
MDRKEPKIIYLPLMGTPHSGNRQELDSRPPFKRKDGCKYNLVPRNKKKLRKQEWKILRKAQQLDNELKKICGN